MRRVTRDAGDAHGADTTVHGDDDEAVWQRVADQCTLGAVWGPALCACSVYAMSVPATSGSGESSLSRLRIGDGDHRHPVARLVVRLVRIRRGARDGRAVVDVLRLEPCGSVHADAPEGAKEEYFDQVERTRDKLKPFIPDFADFAGSRGRTVLEIGVGLGTDFLRFARAGAKVTGIDLTEHGVALVRRRLELEGLEGDVRVADAERLPFADASFGKVYSWGCCTTHREPSVR